MKNIIIIVALLGVVFLSAFNLIEKDISYSEEPGEVDSVMTGKDLFRLNCAGCHGENLEGNLPTFPALVGVETRKTRDQVEQQIKNGNGMMPAMSHLSSNEINAIVGYLFNDEEIEVLVSDFSPEKQGQMLFNSNCAGCHRLTSNDPVPKNANTQMCSMMEPANLAGATSRFSKKEFLNILNMGPCYMPSFSAMKIDEKDALYAFLRTMESEGEPVGRTMMGQQKSRMNMGRRGCCMK
jgi:mono/diheme cytochrome c family protein